MSCGFGETDNAMWGEVSAVSLLTPAHTLQTVQTSRDLLSLHGCTQLAFLVPYIADSPWPDILALPSYLPRLFSSIRFCRSASFT